MIRYRDLRGYKYELAEGYSLDTGIEPVGAASINTLHLSLTHTGGLSIARGYAWDGPSGPAIDTKNFLRASLIHDALYQMIRLGLLPASRRAQADALLRKLCLEDGMSRPRAAWVYSAVRAMGWLSARPEKPAAPIQEAP